MTPTTPPAPPKAHPGDTVWLTDRTGPWKVLAIQGAEAIMGIPGSTTTAKVALTDIGFILLDVPVVLSEEDRAALAALGDDLVDRLQRQVMA